MMGGAVMAFGQEDPVTIGFCQGQVATRSDIEAPGKEWVEAAVRFSATSLAAYKDGEITAVRAGLASRTNIDTLRVWVREDLNGENLAVATITNKSTPAVAKGWNEMALDKPVKISSGKPLYVGYSFHQKNSVHAVSVIGEPVSDVSFYREDDGEWMDLSPYGTLSIEACVSGALLPDYDLAVLSATAMPYNPVADNSVMVIATLANCGVSAVESFTLACTSGEVRCEQHIETPVQPNSVANVSFIIYPEGDVARDAVWTVSVASIDGAEDKIADNNIAQAVSAFRKNALIEEFTTEKCPNCPKMATRLHKLLEENGNKLDIINLVCHHAGFYYDSFTLPCDRQLEWFYNDNGAVYAPAVMFDRSNIYSGKANTPLYYPSSDQLSAALKECLARPANAMVSIGYELNEDTGQLNVTAACVRNDKFESANPTLTLYLTEDNVKSSNGQAGASGDFYHEHLTRAYSTVWGEPVVWKDNEFTYEWSTVIDPSWKLNDLKIVGLIANYDSSSPVNCEVYNSASVSLVSEKDPSAVEGITGDVDITGIYDIRGHRLAAPAPGVNIIRYSDGSARKLIIR